MYIYSIITKISCVIGVILLGLIQSSCATEALMRDNTYNETVESFLMTEDATKLVIIGEKYHYVFDLDEQLRSILLSDKRKKIISEFSNFKVSLDQVITGNYSLAFNNPVQDDLAWLHEVGFSSPQLQSIERKIYDKNDDVKRLKSKQSKMNATNEVDLFTKHANTKGKGTKTVVELNIEINNEISELEASLSTLKKELEIAKNTLNTATVIKTHDMTEHEFKKQAFKKLYSYEGKLKGTRYLANDVVSAKYKFNTPYTVNISEEDSILEKSAKILVSPVTIAFDGALTIGAITLISALYIVGQVGCAVTLTSNCGLKK